MFITFSPFYAKLFLRRLNYPGEGLFPVGDAAEGAAVILIEPLAAPQPEIAAGKNGLTVVSQL